MTKMSEARKRKRGIEQSKSPPATPLPAVTCGTCKYLDASNERPFCRRFPAQLVVVRPMHDSDNGVRSFYPTKNPVLDWCGEHPMLAPQSSAKDIAVV